MSWEDRQSNYDRYPKIKIKEIDKLSSKAYEGYADIVIDILPMPKDRGFLDTNDTNQIFFYPTFLHSFYI